MLYKILMFILLLMLACTQEVTVTSIKDLTSLGIKKVVSIDSTKIGGDKFYKVKYR